MSATVTPEPVPVDGPWPAALDEFERRLLGFRAVLEHDRAPVTGDWPPPQVIGLRLPAELVPRARHLLQSAAELEAALQARQSSLRIRTPAGPRHRPFLGRPNLSTDL